MTNIYLFIHSVIYWITTIICVLCFAQGHEKDISLISMGRHICKQILTRRISVIVKTFLEAQRRTCYSNWEWQRRENISKSFLEEAVPQLSFENWDSRKWCKVGILCRRWVSMACRVRALTMKSFVVMLKARDVVDVSCFFMSLVILGN